METNTTEISLKLTARGRYIWTITSNFKTEEGKDFIEVLKSFDTKLRDMFPDHVQKGTGRVANIDFEEGSD